MTMALDFSRYAPEQRSDPEPEQLHPIRMALSLLWQAISLAFRRNALAFRIGFYRFRHSLFCAWACAGIGWGMGLSLLTIWIWSVS